jgi:hypothetical protein
MKIKLELKKKSFEDKCTFGETVHTQMTGNPVYPTPNPTLLELNTGNTNLKNANNAYKVAKQQADSLYNDLLSKDADWENLIKRLAMDVENTSGGDVTKITSAGFVVKSAPGAPQVPGQVLITAVDESKTSGQLFVKWKKIFNSKTYKVEMSADGTAYTEVDTITKTRITISHLTSGTKYWFRVTAIGSAGKGAPSDPWIKYAP